MRAMILAAGRGQRMRPLTDDLPKPLLRAGRHSLIEYHLFKLAQVGVREVVVNHAWLGDKIEKYLGDGSRYGIKIHYSPEPEGGLETAGGIIRALPLLGTEPFWVINGDIYTDLDFHALPQKLGSGIDAHLLLVDNPPHHPHGDFAIHNGLLAESEAAQKSYTFSGVGLYRPQFFSKYAAGEELFLPLRPLLNEAMQQQRISASVFSQRWVDVGTPERLAELNKELG